MYGLIWRMWVLIGMMILAVMAVGFVVDVIVQVIIIRTDRKRRQQAIKERYKHVE